MYYFAKVKYIISELNVFFKKGIVFTINIKGQPLLLRWLTLIYIFLEYYIILRF